MKLYYFLELTSEEITVFDKDYDTEFYFNGFKGFNVPENHMCAWDIALLNLAKYLEVTNISRKGVEVNLSDLISVHMEKLKSADLFISYDMEDIMADMDRIMSGGVSEEWFTEFTECLSDKKYI